MKHIIKVEVLENLPATRPLIAMDANREFFMQQKAPGPPNDEIWYWGEYYDIESAISALEQQDITYVGPAILSNKQVGDKYVITFDGPVTKLGKEDVENESTKKLYPIFRNTSGTEPVEPACNITRIEIPNSVTSIGNYAFGYCTSLTSITIPNSVTSIGDSAFSDCSSLSSITIPNSVTSIGVCAFIGCDSLTSIEIPNNVTSIGGAAFYGCESLTSVNIPDSVTHIGEHAFGQISAKILFSKIYSTYTNKIFDSKALTNDTAYTINVEFNISEIPTDYNISSMLPQISDSEKGTITYNIYTDYAPCKDQALALANAKTIVNVYHIDGTSWE